MCCLDGFLFRSCRKKFVPLTEGIQKVLIIEIWGIGDLVMMSSVLDPLKARWPTAKITVLAKPVARELFAGDKRVDKIEAFNFPWTAFKGKYCFWLWDWRGILQTIVALRHEKFDLVLDARGDPRNSFLVFLLGAKFFFSQIRRDIRRHRVEHWADILRAVGVEEKLSPRIDIDGGQQQWAQKILEDKFPIRPRVLIGIHPGAAQKVRCWPLDRFQQLAMKIRATADCGILFFIGPDGYGQDLVQNLGLPYFKGNLHELAALIAKLDLLVCNDTGVMHMADAIGIDLVAIFGPGDPAFIGPRGAASIMIKECSYRPCFDHCHFSKAECLYKISADEVMDAVKTHIIRT